MIAEHRCDFSFGEEKFILDASGVIFWPAQNTLLVADLHLEKSSYFLARGNPIPLYDTTDTLKRLEAVCAQYKPEKIICLGDNFHDSGAIERMSFENYSYLSHLMKLMDWYWILGNHDQSIDHHPLLKPFRLIEEKQIEHILLTHMFTASAGYQIIGHFHPKMTLRVRGQTIKGKCFVANENVLILPSFGTYTGGLDIQNSAFKEVFNGQYKYRFIIKNNKIWQIPV